MSLDDGACRSALRLNKHRTGAGDVLNTGSQDIHAERWAAHTAVFTTSMPCVRQRAQEMAGLWYVGGFIERFTRNNRTRSRTFPV